MMRKVIIVLVFSFAFIGNANAALKSYDISWIGANNYSLTGNFQFDAATAGGEVDETELTSFFIQGFLNGSSLGTYSGSIDNFNFNAVTGQFSVGGMSISTAGQRWNTTGTGIGFSAGQYAQSLKFDGNSYFNSRIENEDSTLRATLSTVPLPAALPLYAAGIAVLGFFGYNRQRKSKA